MVMLECYFDDSGTHDQSDVITWGGLLGTERQWDFLDRRWRQLLSEPLPGKPPLKQFHLAHCKMLVGEFRSYTRTESDAVRHAFRLIIIHAKLEAVGYSVAKRDYEELVQGKARRFLGSAEQVAMGGCINFALQRANERRDDFVSLTFDQGRVYPELSEQIEKVRKNYIGHSALVHIGSSPVGSFTPLQAADTVANENNENVREIISNPDRDVQPSSHLGSFINRMDKISSNVLDRRHIPEMLADLRRQFPRGIPERT